jgi:RNA polymerase sigma factor (sigma-70 family)
MDEFNRKFEQFKNRYEQKTLCYLTSRYSSLRQEDIEDVIQEAYIVLVENLRAGKVGGLDYRYFLKICNNLCLKKVKGLGGTIIVSISDDDEFFQEGRVNMSKVDQILQAANEAESKSDEINQMVRDALDRMATKCREMLWNFYANELSWATIAGMFELKNADTAKATANRCRKRLLEKFYEIKKERSGNVK